MEKHYQTIAKKYYELAIQLRRESINRIKEILNGVEGKRLIWPYEELEKYALSPVSLPYPNDDTPVYYSDLIAISLDKDDFIELHLVDGTTSEEFYSEEEVYIICDFLEGLMECRAKNNK